LERCHDICKIFCDISLISSSLTFCSHLYSTTECLSHSREDAYKRTLVYRNIWRAHGKDNWSHSASCVRIMKSCKTVCLRRLLFQCSGPLALLLGHRKWDVEIPFPMSVDNSNTLSYEIDNPRLYSLSTSVCFRVSV